MKTRIYRAFISFEPQKLLEIYTIYRKREREKPFANYLNSVRMENESISSFNRTEKEEKEGITKSCYETTNTVVKIAAIFSNWQF